MQWAVFIHRDRCIGCYSCIVACKLEHDLPPHPACPPVGNPKGPAFIRVDEFGPEMRDDKVHQYFQPILCRHCADAPCIPACPESAIRKDLETGIVVADQTACKGCRSCLDVCPYGAPQFHDETLYLCDLCIHRLGAGRNTACEAACPARAICIGTPDESSTMVGKKTVGRRANRSETTTAGL